MPELITYDKRHFLPNHKAACVFNHLPKCGGTTLNDLLTKSFDTYLIVLFDLYGLKFPEHRIDLLCGHYTDGLEHFLFPRREFYKITFLRNPFLRYISLYYHQKTIQPYDQRFQVDINTFLFQSSHILKRNPFIQFFGNGDKYYAEKNILEDHVFVGFVEYFEDSIKNLSEIIPQIKQRDIVSKNITPKKNEHINELAKEFFYEQHKEDFELYEKVKKEFLSRVTITQTQKHIPSIETINKTSILNKEAIRDNVDKIKNTILNGKLLPEVFRKGKINEINLSRMLTSLNTAQEYKIFLSYLMVLMEEFKPCLYFAYECAKKGKLPQLYSIAKLLFLELEKFDPNNHSKQLTVVKLEIIQTLLEHMLYGKGKNFDDNLMPWLENLYENSHFTWQVASLRMQARLYLEQGSFSKAIKLLEEAIAKRPYDHEILFELSKALIQSGKNGIASAEHAAKGELEKNPHALWALKQLLMVELAKNNEESIVKLLNTILECDPCWSYGLSLQERLKHKASTLN